MTVGAFETSTHNGTHVDAPLHVEAGGHPVDQLDARALVGPATVVDATRAPVIDAGWLRRQDAARDAAQRAPRLLFKTSETRDGTAWLPNFPPFTAEAIDLLATWGCVLVGTDAPSVDAADSTTLPAHHALVRNGIVNAENLLLNEITPGLYIVVIQPLRLDGMDAAPAGAMLFTPAEWRAHLNDLSFLQGRPS